MAVDRAQLRPDDRYDFSLFSSGRSAKLQRGQC